MRIAQFTDSFLPIVDGVGTVVLSYANCLAEKGHECYVMAPMTDTGFRGGQKYELIDFHSVRVQQYKLGIPLVDTHFHARMKNVELDIIHAHSPFTAGQTAANFAKKRDLPFVGTFHSKYRDDFYQATGINMVADVGAKFVVDYFDKCDEVWAVCQNSADTLHEYGYKKDIFIMPNGADSRCVSGKSAEDAREHFGLGTYPVFLFVGQMNWKKNLERVLLASSALAGRGYGFKLVFAGQGSHLEEIKLRTQELGLEDRTVFTGHISDSALLAGLYKSALLFVFPSLYDMAPLVVREAAQNGTPTVAVAGSGAAEVITDRTNGLLCEDDTDSLMRAMKYALENPDDAKMMGKQAMKTIPVGVDEILDKVLDRYQYLIDRRSIR